MVALFTVKMKRFAKGTKKTNKGYIALVEIVLVVTFLGCIEERSTYEEPSASSIKDNQESAYISFDELYNNIPNNLTDRKVWEQWEREYKGRYVMGSGRLDAIEVYQKKGHLFLIFSIPNGEYYTEDNVKVLFLVEDAYTLLLGEEEYEFFINDIKRICLGDSYIFIGQVSNFSSFDMDLVFSGYSGMIIVEGRTAGIREV
jgi:hypothetical protein